MTASALPRVLIPESKIKQRLKEMATEIAFDYRGKELTVICVLKGSFIFFADLIRDIDLPMSCEFMGVSSYGNKTTSSGEVKVTLDLTEPLSGKHVVIIEDIVDTGLTLSRLLELLGSRGAASVKLVSFLDKPEPRIMTELKIDYTGFIVPNEYVVGYGLDSAGRYRNLPFVAVVKDPSAA